MGAPARAQPTQMFNEPSVCVCAHTRAHTHTHTQRDRERETVGQTWIFIGQIAEQQMCQLALKQKTKAKLKVGLPRICGQIQEPIPIHRIGRP